MRLTFSRGITASINVILGLVPRTHGATVATGTVC